MKNLVLHVLFFLSTFYFVSAQQSYTFTSAGATGSLGPTQGQINASYFSTNLNGSVVISPTAGIQTFTIPTTLLYRIEAFGAQGVGTYGGRGAKISGEFALSAGTVLKILVGQVGQFSSNSAASYQVGGGGGTYVTSLANVPYVVAGGGGGSWATSFTGLSDGTISTSGTAGQGTSGGIGGSFGNGGSVGVFGDGGAGFFGNGSIANVAASAPKAFINGGTGGTYLYYGIGGFGGGGGTTSDNGVIISWAAGCGGGGGYSGGGGSADQYTSNPEGGGGGSYNNGVNQTNLSGVNLGDGKVIITELCDVKITASGTTSSLNPIICTGTTLTLTTNAVSGYSWSTGNTTSSVIVVSPTSNTVFTVFGTSSLACQAYGSISITVSGGLPTLSVTTGMNPICNGASTSLTASGAITYTWTGGITNGNLFTPSVTTTYTVTGQNGCGTNTAFRTITVSPLAISTLASPTLVCEGYTTALTVVSSVGGYTWSPGNLVGSSVIAVPMALTIYTVTASDGTCTGTQTVQVTTKTTPIISAAATSTRICEGQNTSINASGAGTNGTYSWSPTGGSSANITVSPSASTLFIVIGTNSLNCSSSAQAPVVVDLNPIMNAVANKTLLCTGGQVTLAASGAGSYVWSTGSTGANLTLGPLTSNTICSVIGTSATNTCTAVKSLTISLITPTVNYSSNVSICSGQSATLTASGATSYTWNGIPVGTTGQQVFTPAQTSTYVLLANTQSVTTNCPSSYTATVTVNPNPTITAVPTKTATLCKGVTNTLTANGATSYTWVGTTGNGSVVTINPNVTTNYTVIGVNQFGCESSAQVQAKIASCVGIEENGLSSSINIFPNPNAGEFTITTAEDLNLSLINNLGQVIRHIEFNQDNNHQINVSDLSNGIYFLVGSNGSEKINTKIVVGK